ncbi:isochorismatase family protein [Ramlibacter humi]|uniref:Isochorismatase family protein n=1 Tax=Ramlibacter humi TaxID=2530451 RepID=A0A4Z0C9Z1_9BURK|nr:isochorismatase family protein [Ramlibacter humi]TFZ08487.1 isochorismatase family protein [Ramlibacter humi]
MLLDADDCLLVLVDYQQRLMPAIHEGPAVVASALKLAQAARLAGVPAFGTEQNPQGLGPLDPALPPLLASVLPKMSFGAAEVLLPVLRPPARKPSGNARSLPKHLQKPVAEEPGRNSVVLAGCEAHVCLLQTALELLDQEFDVWVVTDACSSRTERNRDAAFDRLAGAGCELVTTEMVVFEWLRSAEHPRFREALALVK